MYFLAQSHQPASATLFFAGLMLLCIYRLGGNKLLRLIRMRMRASRRRASGHHNV
ncbi:hypothetical protein XaFJ1_GM001525 [Xanthomonas albilineans]|nr:hypothetical protein XaFJ1_GM001525 [Xanthomonas albilineans]